MAKRKEGGEEVKGQSVGEVGNRINQIVTKAIEDYNLGKDYRRMDVAAGVRRAAHGWCVDLAGKREYLLRAGVALASWLDDDAICKEVTIKWRSIEVFRPWGINGGFELSVRYTPEEIEQIE